MKFFKTTVSLIALSLTFQASDALASNVPEEMVIFGSYKNTDSMAEWTDGTQEIGKIAVSNGNKETFIKIPKTGTAVQLTDANKALYEKIVYTQDDLRLKLGKTFGVVPKFKGEDDNAPRQRMRIGKLSYLNVE